MGVIFEFILSVIFEFILSVIIGPIIGFTLRLFAFIVLDILFDGIRHAVLFIRYGWKYKKQLDASYSDSGIGPVGRFSANVIMFIWVLLFLSLAIYIISMFF